MSDILLIFQSENGKRVEWSPAQLVQDGTPIDDNGDDMEYNGWTEAPVPPGHCTGYLNRRIGLIQHDGDTCPIHEDAGGRFLWSLNVTRFRLDEDEYIEVTSSDPSMSVTYESPQGKATLKPIPQQDNT